MAWLASLDARARHWPQPVFWGYTVLKWYLVAVGAFGLFYAWTQNEFSPPWLKTTGEALLHALDAMW